MIELDWNRSTLPLCIPTHLTSMTSCFDEKDPASSVCSKTLKGRVSSSVMSSELLLFLEHTFTIRTRVHGVPGRVRTCDLWFRRPALFPAELQGLDSSRPGGVRTLILRFWRPLFYQLNYRPRRFERLSRRLRLVSLPPTKRIALPSIGRRHLRFSLVPM